MSDLSTEQKREAIRAVYKQSESWHAKCDKMSDAQVIAIYLRFKAEGKLAK